MKVKVIKRFRDKHTRKIHKVNDALTVSQERFDEILTVGKLVEEIKEEPEGEKTGEHVNGNAVEVSADETAEKKTKKTTKKAE